MKDERLPPSSLSSLRGRLADVFIPALVEGSLAPLSRRLGSRATIDDPRTGRASRLGALEALLANFSGYLRDHAASYRHRASTTGIDRDLCEGVIAMTIEDRPREMPIVVVAIRRRLREIELRLYYAPPEGPGVRPPRAALAVAPSPIPLPQLVAHVFDALAKGAVERVLSAFEDASQIVDPHGRLHAKRDGGMASFVSDLGARVDVDVAGSADDGRTCGIEAMLALPGREAVPAVLAFERGDTGLFRELRLYYE